MKIALIGTSCAGKTTVLKSLEEKYSSSSAVLIVPEVARRFFIDNPMPDAQRFSAETQRLIREKIIESELKATQTGAKVVYCDNAPITAAAFTAASGDRSAALQTLQDVHSHMNTYDYIYVVDPRDVPYKNDAVRKEKEHFRNEVHNYLVEFLTLQQLYFQLLSGTNEERLVQLEKHIP